MKGFEDLYWTYKGLIEFTEKNAGYYGMEEKRSELHRQMEKYFEGREHMLKEVLHNLTIDMQASDVIWAINNIEKFRQDAKLEGRHYSQV